MSERSERRLSARRQSTSTGTAAAPELTTALPLTRKRKRDSLQTAAAQAQPKASTSSQIDGAAAEDDSEAVEPTESLQRSTSRRSLRRSARQSLTGQQPSSKALGKRRAVSPDETPIEPSQPTSKRRKVDSPGPRSFNLRPRGKTVAPIASTSTSAAKSPRKSRKMADAAPSKSNSGRGKSRKRQQDVVIEDSDGDGAAELLHDEEEEEDDEDEEAEMPIEAAAMDVDENDDEEPHPDDHDSINDEHEDQMDEDDAAAIRAAQAAARAAGAGIPAGLEGLMGDAGFGAAVRASLGGMSGMSTRLKNLLNSLKQRSGDPSLKLIALQELSELLAISSEDTLAGYFSVDQFSKELVNIVKGDDVDSEFAVEQDSIEMMVLATRSLCNMMEALPGSAHAVIYSGAVPALCSKLLEIQFIDLAEQVLITLEKISEELPGPIVREGGLTAILTYLDFFSTNVQRTAVTTAANCCRNLPVDSFQLVLDVVPILRGVLGYSDQRVVEQACLALVRIVESYRHHPDKLERLLQPELIGAVLGLLVPGATSISPATYTQVLRMLAHAARASPEVAIALLDKDIASTIYLILVGIAAPVADGNEVEGIRAQHEEDDMIVLTNLVHRPKDQVQEALSLVTELLPTLPRDGVFSSKPGKADRKKKDKEPAIKREEVSPGLGGPSTSTSAHASADETPIQVKSETSPAVDALLGSSSSSSANRPAANDRRVEFVTGSSMPDERRQAVIRFHTLMLPTLVDVYSASVGVQVRTKALLGMAKTIQFCPSDALDRILTIVPMAAFLGTMLATRDQPTLVTSGLQLAELLLIKKPDTYQYVFRREGVMHEIEQMASATLVAPPKASRKFKGVTAQPPTPGDPETGADLGSRAVLPPINRSPSALTRALQGSHVPGSAPATPQSIVVDAPELQAKDANTLRARYIRDKFARADTDSSRKAERDLDDLKSLADELGRANSEEAMLKALERVAALFSSSEGTISSFEMLESGLVGSLLRFANASDDTERRQALLWKAFSATTGEGEIPTALNNLVKRLQESMGRLEDFAIVTAQSSAADDSRRSSTSMLARQLKLRLIGEGEGIPKTCSNVIVSIHAIATFQAFNDYLRPRIVAAQGATERGAFSAPAGGSSRVSGALAAFAAAAGLGDLNALADGARLSTSLGASTSSAPNATPALPKGPTRRRSQRLEKKSSGAGEEPEASTSHAAAEPEDEDDEEELDDPMQDDCDDDGLFPGEFEQPVPPVEDERPTNLSVADDGKVEASTPEGTRVSTPKLHKGLPDRPGSAASSHTPVASSSSSGPRKSVGSYAAALKREPTDFHLQFTMDGQDVPLDMTVYGAVHQVESRVNASSASKTMWNSIHTVRFRKVNGPAAPISHSGTPEPTGRALGVGSSLASLSGNNEERGTPESISPTSRIGQILQLLRVLHALNSDPPVELNLSADLAAPAVRLSEQAFVNNKLTSKANRQLEEIMVVASSCLPAWSIELPHFFQFLFPMATRLAFLQSTSFGYARLLNRWTSGPRQEQSNGRRESELAFLGRLARQKVRISRNRMLESAVKIFELYASSKAALEVEYFEEVGTGLGPTLEFYATVSRELQRKDLGLWRGGDNDSANPSAFVFNPAGLFPAPLSSNELETERGKKILLMFKIAGQFIAKSLMDNRIVDLPFNREWMRLVLDGQLAPPTLATIRTVDRSLARSLEHMLTATEDEITELSVDFTLPGTDIELKAGGSSIAVTQSNVADYVKLVTEYTVRTAVEPQTRAFRQGFSTVFPVRDLRTFTPDELVILFGNVAEDWSIETLNEALRADHGFNSDSPSIRHLIEIMSTYDTEERRSFLQFITGSPKLPVGGFSALSPPLTIVRRGSGPEADSMLPSVMTCANYLKLPSYSGIEIMRSRLDLAMKEGAGAFLLS